MVLGIDIGKSSFFVHLLKDMNDGGYHRSFENNAQGFAELQEWLMTYNVNHLHACMEAAGPYGTKLAEFLVSCQYKISVVNPTRIRRYAESRLERVKTDKRDAFVIALFCLKEQPHPWVPMPEDLKKLRELDHRVDELKKIKQQESNRLEAELGGAIRKSVAKLIKFLEAEIAKIEMAITRHIARSPAVKEQIGLLVSIPGISTLTARRLVTEINFANFQSAKAVAAFIGLTPAIRESGTSIRKHTMISRVGNKNARTALFFPALVGMRHNPIIKQFAESLLTRGKTKMVTVCAAMRKLLHIAYGVLKNKRPFDPNYLQSAVV